jgi:hypothetical protein
MSRKSSTVAIPEEYLCPISWGIMTNPVILSDGHTYDKSSIRYIKNSLSPITKLPVNIKKPIPNRLIKGFIDKFIVENKIKLSGKKKPNVPKTKSNSKTKQKQKTKIVKSLSTQSTLKVKVKPKWRF